MWRLSVIRATALALLAGLTAAATAPDLGRAGPASAPAAGEVSPLVIETAGGPHRLRVEVAATPSERARGLMHRRTLAPDAGMLFVYPSAQPVSMWMKNTYVPLDILFIGPKGRIFRIVPDAEPLSTRHIPSRGPAAAVLELPAGTAARLGIRPGDRVRHPRLDAAGDDG